MRLLALLAASSLIACASAPAPKMRWDEAGFASTEAQENATADTIDPEELVRQGRLSPLAVSTVRFSGVERALRSQGYGKPMPPDAQRAWSGLFAAIDQTLSGDLKATRGDLVRARLAARAELDQDSLLYSRLPSGLDAAVTARIQALEEKVRHGRLPRAVVEASGLSWPLPVVTMSSLYGPRLDPVDHQAWKRHEGVDLAAEKGALVMAAGAGVVTEAGERSGYGLLVAIRHHDGTITRYGHLSQLLTRQGMVIERGGAVGLVGATGHATGPHLHFEVWKHGRALDPVEELGDPAAAEARVAVQAR